MSNDDIQIAVSGISLHLLEETRIVNIGIRVADKAEGVVGFISQD